jgi:hypothetical protein
MTIQLIDDIHQVEDYKFPNQSWTFIHLEEENINKYVTDW